MQLKYDIKVSVKKLIDVVLIIINLFLSFTSNKYKLI